MASEQDAARDRVLAARADLAFSLADLEASGRAAVDIPTRIRRSPAKAAAIGGGVLFVLLRGPQRLLAALRRRFFGAPPPMPKGLLPKDVEKTLQSLGDDGEKVRKVLERDFADYVKTSQKDRKGLISVALLALIRPMVASGARRGWTFLTSPSPEGYATRLDEVRARLSEKAGEAREAVERAGSTTRERVDRATDEAKVQVDRAADAAKGGVDRAADAAMEGVGRTSGAAKDRLEQVRGSMRSPGEDPPTRI